MKMNSKYYLCFTILFVIIYWINGGESILDHGFMSRGFQHYRPNLRRDLILHWGKTGQLEGKFLNITKPGVNITIEKLFHNDTSNGENKIETVNFNMEKPGIKIDKSFDHEDGKKLNIEKPGVKIEKIFNNTHQINEDKNNTGAVSINIEKNGRVVNIERPFHYNKIFNKENMEKATVDADKIKQNKNDIENDKEYKSIVIENSEQINDIFGKKQEKNNAEEESHEHIQGLRYCSDSNNSEEENSNHPCIVEKRKSTPVPVQDTSMGDSLEKRQKAVKLVDSLEQVDSIEKLFKDPFPVLMKIYDSNENQNNEEKYEASIESKPVSEEEINSNEVN